MLKRDPQDPHRRERVAGSYLVSLILHAMAAILLFSIAASSAQEGASESVSGGTIVTLEQRVPVVAQAASPVQESAPMPNVPRIAPVVAHAPLIRAESRPQPPQHHELSQFSPSAPPNPTPLPQASQQPNPQPTAPIYEPNPQNELPAVPTSVPSVAMQAVAVKIPPTAAPSPQPSIVPTARPTPHPAPPTSAPSPKPETPAPVSRPSATPTVAPVVAQATARPSATPAPVSHPSVAPAATSGVPSPSPTQGARLTASRSLTPTPGPKGQSSPGPRAGNAGTSNKAIARAITVPPTPSPVPEHSSSSGGNHGGIDINAKLRALLPHNAVNPTQMNVSERVALNESMDPTPPPDVLQQTKYLFEERGSGGDSRVKMWVTSVRHDGPALICDGWLLRYPRASQPDFAHGTMAHPVSGGIQVSSGSLPGGTLPPIVEEHASTTCTERALVPFAPPPTPSP
jgi:hypothetical protein